MEAIPETGLILVPCKVFLHKTRIYILTHTPTHTHYNAYVDWVFNLAVFS